MAKKIFVLAVLSILVLSLPGCGREQGKPGSSASKPVVNAPAPDFTTKNILTGKELRLSDYKGKVTLVNLWATWCPPCREEIPSMGKLYQRYKGKVAIIAISVDEDSDEKVTGFAKKYGMQFDVAHDDGSLNRIYGTGSIPTTYIVDKNGVIIDKVVGGVDWSSQEVYGYFDKLVKK